MTTVLNPLTLLLLTSIVTATPPAKPGRDPPRFLLDKVTFWTNNHFSGSSYSENPLLGGACQPVQNLYDSKKNSGGYGRGSFSVPPGIRCKLHKSPACTPAEPWHDQTDWLWSPGWTDWGNIYFSYTAYQCRAGLDATDPSPNQNNANLPAPGSPDDVMTHPGRCAQHLDSIDLNEKIIPGPCGHETGLYPADPQPCIGDEDKQGMEVPCKRSLAGEWDGEDRVIVVNGTAVWQFSDGSRMPVDTIRDD